MKEFFFIDNYPQSVGGMETHAQAYIAHRKHSKNFFVIGFSESQETFYKKEDNIHVFKKGAIHNPREVISFLRSCDIHPGDVFFFNSLYWIETFEKLRASFPGVIFLLRSGGNDIMQSSIKTKGDTLDKRRHFVVTTINNHIDALIVNSTYTFKRFKRLGIKRSIMHVIRGGVDTATFKTETNKRKHAQLRKKLEMRKNAFVFICVCRLQRFKGIEYLLKAFRPLANKYDAQLFLVGDGPLLHDISQMIKKLELDDNVICTKEVPLNLVSQYYAVADAYAQTPIRARTFVRGGSYIHTETMGRSLCEAVSAGLPIVTTNVGGVPEIVSQRQGYRVTPKDIKGTENALRSIITSPSKRKTMRDHSLKKKEYLDWEHIFTSYMNIINAIKEQ